jgi:hypothetical protein
MCCRPWTLIFTISFENKSHLKIKFVPKWVLVPRLVTRQWQPGESMPVNHLRVISMHIWYVLVCIPVCVNNSMCDFLPRSHTLTERRNQASNRNLHASLPQFECKMCLFKQCSRKALCVVVTKYSAASMQSLCIDLWVQERVITFLSKLWIIMKPPESQRSEMGLCLLSLSSLM